MRFLRILPAVWPRISWPFSRRTRNIALGSSSTTCPRISSNSSLAKQILFRSGEKSRRLSGAATKREGGGNRRSGRIIFIQERLHRLQELDPVLGAAEMVAAEFLFEIFERLCRFLQLPDQHARLLYRHGVVL